MVKGGGGARTGFASSFQARLIAHIHRCAEHSDTSDVDALVQQLRKSHDAYARLKLPPFRKHVVRALDVMHNSRRVTEVNLQTRESRDANDNDTHDTGSSSSSDGVEGDALTAELDSPSSHPTDAPAASNNDGNAVTVDQGIADPLTGRILLPGTSLNAALLGMYAPTAPATAAMTTPDKPTPEGLPDATQRDAVAAQQGGTFAASALQSSTPTTANAVNTGALTVLTMQKGKGSKARTAQEAGATRAPEAKRLRKAAARAASAVAAPLPLRFADLGGMEPVLQLVRELVQYPLKHPEVYRWLGVDPPRGVLLHGPPGCGKTALANAIANECDVPFLKISAPEVVSGMSGESEATLRALFQEARSVAPSIIFIDEIDAIMPKREAAQREMERRIVAQMLTCMDDLSGGGTDTVEGQQTEENGTPVDGRNAHVVVIGATNRPDALDPALRRAGRFDREIPLGVPTEAARLQILRVLSSKLRLAGDVNLQLVAKHTPGYVGADLQALTKEAAAIAVRRVFWQQGHTYPRALEQAAQASPAAQPASALSPLVCTKTQATTQSPRGHLPAAQPWKVGGAPLTPAQLVDCVITGSDLEEAVRHVQPSVRREGFTTAPDVAWDDVGSLEQVREELSFAISQPIAHPERFEALGLPLGHGVLLFGPPGCGKTLVAKAVANDSGANFISIKGPELLNKYVGESERAVRQLFARARAAAPCVLFFDEMDALAPRRGSDVNQSTERVVNQLLTEMDGVEGRAGVYLIAATNRPDMIDPALLRPGRLEKILYIPLPAPAERVSILRALTRSTPLGPDVDLDAVGRAPASDGLSGADLAALVREAAVASLKESLQQGSSAAPLVCARHFASAASRVTPSVSRADQRIYDGLRTKLRASRSHLKAQTRSETLAGPSETQARGPGEDMEQGPAVDDGGPCDMDDVSTAADAKPMDEGQC